MSSKYEVLQWRKRLERCGWRNARRFPPPRHRWIEYHALWQGWLISGRCKLDEQGDGSYWEPGAHAYVIHRMQDVEEAVWRFATKEGEGRVVRAAP